MVLHITKLKKQHQRQLEKNKKENEKKKKPKAVRNQRIKDRIASLPVCVKSCFAQTAVYFTEFPNPTSSTHTYILVLMEAIKENFKFHWENYRQPLVL
ncbi:CLUMA_CG008861, isoform A [Clunio marinus]|uniref:CLUMA_CG008861, isoform A n=1 Tax=Clunio marinus TaxID=568069 RepID=A0A1J1I582_9DIPT|nr:CLUMA_CG008861, isoform A [Clunio marinus]